MRFIVIFIFFIALTNVLYSQSDSVEITATLEKNLYISGGISFPYLPSEFQDYYDKGFNGGLGFGYSFEPGNWGYSSLYVLARYNKFNFNESSYRNGINKTSPDTIISGGAVNVFTFTLNYKGTFSKLEKFIAPYFTVGIGYMYLASDSVRVNRREMFSIEGETLSTFTWSFGVGIEVPFSNKITGYAQGESFIGVFDRTRQYFPISVGVRVQF